MSHSSDKGSVSVQDSIVLWPVALLVTWLVGFSEIWPTTTVMELFGAGVLMCLLLAGLWYVKSMTVSIHWWLWLLVSGCLVVGTLGFQIHQQNLQQQTVQILPKAIWVQGQINSLVSMPSSDPSPGVQARFQLLVSHWQPLDANRKPSESDWQVLPKPLSIRVRWYRSVNDQQQPLLSLSKGQVWQLPLRLKAASGYVNDAGFRYEQWLHQQGVVATAYVKRAAAVKLLQQGQDWRQSWLHRLQQQWQGTSILPIMQGLILGDRSAMLDDHWQVFQATATSHLMAISGMHVGLVALFVGVFVMGLVRWCLPCLRRWPLHFYGVVAGLLAASVYVWLSGMAVPAMRAWVMLAVASTLVLLRWPLEPWRALVLAWCLVLMLMPGAIWSAGLYLSFGVVALIFAMWQTRPQWFQVQGKVHWLKSLVVMQLVISLVTLPGLGFWFGQWPLMGLVTNVWLVPLFSVLVLPLMLLLALGSLFWSWPLLVIEWVDWVWQGLWWLMVQSAQIPPVSGSLHWLVWLVLTGVLLLLLLHTRQVGVGILWLVRQWRWAWLVWPFLWLSHATNQPLDSWQFRLHVLDVGQGQSVLLQWRDEQRRRVHWLVDVGPGYKSGFNTGEAVVMPTLRQLGIDRLDGLVLSHNDADHIGGMPGLLDGAVAIEQVVSGQPLPVALQSALPASRFLDCADSPTVDLPGGWHLSFLAWSHWSATIPRADNDQSCVVVVHQGHSSPFSTAIWLMGDLSQRGEKALLKQSLHRPFLARNTLLVSGHHGSKTSSSLAWLQAISPGWVVHSAGFANAYQMPHAQVWQRVEQVGAQQFSTACQGQWQWQWTEKGAIYWRASRHERLPWFYRRCESDEGASKGYWQPLH